MTSLSETAFNELIFLTRSASHKFSVALVNCLGCFLPVLNSWLSLETREFWAFWFCFLKLRNLCCASTGKTGNEPASLFQGTWSALSRLISSSDQSRSSSEVRYAPGRGLAEARNVSNCSSRCSSNSFGKALVVVDFPVDSQSINVLVYYNSSLVYYEQARVNRLNHVNADRVLRPRHNIGRSP